MQEIKGLKHGQNRIGFLGYGGNGADQYPVFADIGGKLQKQPVDMRLQRCDLEYGRMGPGSYQLFLAASHLQ
ncbi:hypothetical protein D3C87_1788600 [compost metagenome]